MSALIKNQVLIFSSHVTLLALLICQEVNDSFKHTPTLTPTPSHPKDSLEEGNSRRKGSTQVGQY